ncbi:MAG: hypothetical protein CVV24_00105 [Ignavibacteriae bacterium HGW-Ignavibacteriae-3]|nr:MAG: hypothetical protein CVV24_00105 [Ignavibacteriae bacterium HGW-Ignavibacteriae-3]
MARQHTRSSFKTIEEILNTESEFVNLRESLKNYNIVDEFEKIFPELKIIARAVKVEKQALFLRVENSVWKSELNFRKNLIAEKINKHFGQQVIKSIRFL